MLWVYIWISLENNERLPRIEGYEVKSPRSTIKTAFQIQLVYDGATWIDALEKRNLMAHTYDEKVALEAEILIRSKYYPVIKELSNLLEGYLWI